jgi:hypothetical protein
VSFRDLGALCLIFAACGAQAQMSSAWPRPIALAGSWDPALVREVHSAASRDIAARGVTLAAGPSLEVSRDPRRGDRVHSYGEDPFLVGEMGVAAIEGLQRSGRVQAAIGGFAGYGPASGDVGPAPLAERELRNTFFPPFEEALRRAKVSTVVASRNDIDGIPSSANAWLIKGVLRGEWRFAGQALAAPGAIAELSTLYHVAANANEARRMARDAGLDGEMPAAPGTAARPLDEGERGLARKAARRSIILLKNDGVLPFARRADVSAQVAYITADEPLPAGKPLVVVLLGDVPAVRPDIALRANAIVAAWGLGDEGRAAIEEVLRGEFNPGGKLPVTIARNAGQLPLFHDPKPSARRGYLFDTSEPLYPFGFGLSYTTFEIGAPKLSSTTIAPDGSVEVSVEVRNTGARAGDETVQVYVRDKIASVTRPIQQLRGFERVTLLPGEARTLKFTLGPRAFEMWDERMRRIVEPGEFEVMAGSSSAKLQSATLTITADR